ncbi:DUF2567 domain-containing protein [Solwaraspora sp. WMMA2080]|uniref:DUF2567 domain-containing protein n=1 Tax=unclassified Solwaraspora TaxID=2627926 RepID=UPI00248ADADA|nr:MULTISPECIES: DUF2567 domain-containing protein [unclassified Solwaraspora]WBB94960.1 DUF2567 domain-containing protein [Solwaraspora sp. WMMA2059]WBC21157.1 DUF2567 domain-containing protein [Solwaraspora sp. WMMA2080]
MSSTADAGPPGDPTGPSGASPAPPPDTGAVEPTRAAGRRRIWRRPGLYVAAAITVGGAPLGVAWSMLAPWIPVVRTEQGAAVRGGAPEYFVAADGWFAMLGVGYGILAGIVVWASLPRSRGPYGLVAVTVGGLGAAALAWTLGRQIGLAGYQRALETAALGAQLERPPDLQAGDFDLWFGVLPTVTGAFGAPALGAVLAYTMLAGWSSHPDLRPEPDQVGAGPDHPDLRPEPVPDVAADPRISSDSPESPTRATGPAPPAPGAAAPPPD